MDHRKTTDILAEIVDLDGKRIVDVGCGDGAISRFLAGQGAHVTGIDASPQQIGRARQTPRVADETYQEGVGEKLPLADGSADTVLFINSLHHIPTAAQSQALREAHRVLARGGRLIVVEPLAEGPNFEVALSFDDETAVRAEAYAALKAATSHGFREIAEKTYVNPVTVKDFEDFKQRRGNVDEARRAVIARVEARLHADFTRLAVATQHGFRLDQPTRVNILEKTG